MKLKRRMIEIKNKKPWVLKQTGSRVYNHFLLQSDNAQIWREAGRRFSARRREVISVGVLLRTATLRINLKPFSA